MSQYVLNVFSETKSKKPLAKEKIVMAVLVICIHLVVVMAPLIALSYCYSYKN